MHFVQLNSLWLLVTTNWSCLSDHKLKHGFIGSPNPMFSCGLDTETACHYLLHCHNFTEKIPFILNTVSRINEDILTTICDTSVVELLLYSNYLPDLATNTVMLNASVYFISSIIRLGSRVIQNCFFKYYVVN